MPPSLSNNGTKLPREQNPGKVEPKLAINGVSQRSPQIKQSLRQIEEVEFFIECYMKKIKVSDGSFIRCEAIFDKFDIVPNEDCIKSDAHLLFSEVVLRIVKDIRPKHLLRNKSLDDRQLQYTEEVFSRSPGQLLHPPANNFTKSCDEDNKSLEGFVKQDLEIMSQLSSPSTTPTPQPPNLSLQPPSTPSSKKKRKNKPNKVKRKAQEQQQQAENDNLTLPTAEVLLSESIIVGDANLTSSSPTSTSTSLKLENSASANTHQDLKVAKNITHIASFRSDDDEEVDEVKLNTTPAPITTLLASAPEIPSSPTSQMEQKAENNSWKTNTHYTLKKVNHPRSYPILPSYFPPPSPFPPPGLRHRIPPPPPLHVPSQPPLHIPAHHPTSQADLFHRFTETAKEIQRVCPDYLMLATLLWSMKNLSSSPTTNFSHHHILNNPAGFYRAGQAAAVHTQA